MMMQTHTHFVTFICSPIAYSWPGIGEEGSLAMRSSTHPEGRHLPGVQNGVSRQGEKQEEGPQAGTPEQLFLVG